MSLAQKLAVIMGEVGGLPKEGRNTSQNYNFVTADAVMTALRERFSEHGIAFFTSMTDVWQDTIEKTKTYDGKTTTQVYTHTRARFEFTFIDSEDGTTYTCVWFGESDDYGDKGVNKCATAAVKYFLLKMFLIHTADQSDSDSEKPIQRQSGQSGQGNQQRRASTPNRGENGHSTKQSHETYTTGYLCNVINTIERDGRKLLQFVDGSNKEITTLASREPLHGLIDPDVLGVLGSMGRHTLLHPIKVMVDVAQDYKFVGVEKA